MASANNSSRIRILFCLVVLGLCTEGRPTDNTIDSQSNGISNDDRINSVINRTAETFYNIYDPLSNHTKGFVDSNSYSINNETIWEEIVDLTKNCSIVIGGALGGAGIGIIAVLIIVPLALCVLGFTCWGIMAGSAAACCQSGIGDVPADGCFACVQSLGAGGGGCTYLTIACIIGIPVGLYVGGMYAETYYHCFTSGTSG